MSKPELQTSMRLVRSVLAVPGHRYKMVQSAAASAADGVFIDLEDAVPPSEKAEALEGAVKALNELDWGRKVVTVRVNSFDGKLVEDEIKTLKGAARLDTILIPKVECVDTLRQAEDLIENEASGCKDLWLEALIETAGGLANVETIAAARGRLVGLHFGVGDFSASIGARNVEVGGTHAGYAVTRRDDVGNYVSVTQDLWSYPMMRILVAARANGLRAVDGPFGGFRDLVLTRSMALKAAAMGFDGKQVIHPAQIEVTRAAFTPTTEEVSQARAMVSAMEEAEAQGLAAVSVNGKMVDYANLRMARRILLMAETK
ncbi:MULTISPECIES: CoA ester lyase [unclassified Caballeronia]|uniref:HpcH/HpaI aldolase/citrate lyase family protein n=1 Tax=unclassified Caballeronia TaxID=2646786 RepID=UPI002027C5AD|nr:MULTISPECIES: CoA ester lyase [unclassified Caballeronia]MDR5765845.1 CoA ester lyase [Caballeronia sp. LZ028]